jgi:hypothetical protein
MTGPALIGPYLQLFFTDHLVAQRRLSPQQLRATATRFACCCNLCTVKRVSNRHPCRYQN